MKGLAKVFAFIFLTTCTIAGLGLNKVHQKYLKDSVVVDLFVRLIFFLAIFRVALLLIVPLVQGILEYLNITISLTGAWHVISAPIVVIPVCLVGIYALFGKGE